MIMMVVVVVVVDSHPVSDIHQSRREDAYFGVHDEQDIHLNLRIKKTANKSKK